MVRCAYRNQCFHKLAGNVAAVIKLPATVLCIRDVSSQSKSYFSPFHYTTFHASLNRPSSLPVYLPDHLTHSLEPPPDLEHKNEASKSQLFENGARLGGPNVLFGATPNELVDTVTLHAPRLDALICCSLLP